MIEIPVDVLVLKRRLCLCNHRNWTIDGYAGKRRLLMRQAGGVNNEFG